MLLTIARHEYRYATFSFSSLTLFSVILGLAFLLTANSSEFVDTARGGHVFINSPYMITLILLITGIFSIFLVPGFMATAVLRDVDAGFDPILFSLPIHKGAFLGGRFVGAFAALVTVLSAAPLGMILGCLAPWADQTTLAPLRLSHYALVFWGWLVPSLLVSATFIFSVAAMSRRLIYSYVTALASLILYMMVSETNLISPLWDPFMHRILEETTAYWTAAERNSRLLGYEGMVLANRALWLVLAAAFYGLAYLSFSFRTRPRPPKRIEETPPPVNAHLFAPQATRPVWHRRALWTQLVTRIRFEITATLASPPFLMVLVLSGSLVAVSLLDRADFYGVNAYPLTRFMIAAVTGSNWWALLAVLGFYSAEMIHRERSAGFAPLLDATPVANWMMITAKLVGLIAVMGSVLGLGMLLAIAYQLYDGSVQLELTLYVKRIFFLYIVPYVYLAILACFFQIIAPNRMIGMLLMGLFMLVSIGMNDLLGSEHPLLKYGLGGFYTPYSDMNGHGRFLFATSWLHLYWGGIAGLLLIATYALQPRGTWQPLHIRLQNGLTRGQRRLAVASSLLILGAGGFIFYNTNIRNQHETRQEQIAQRAAFEHQLGTHQSLPMPRITDVTTEIALYPNRGRVETTGRYLLVNKTTEPLDTLHLVIPGRLEVTELSLEGGRQTHHIPEFQFYAFTMTEPMAPGEQRTLSFATVLQQNGFTSGAPDLHLVRNGTFLTNSRLTPFIGVDQDFFLRDPADRRFHGLEPMAHRPNLDDTRHHHTSVNRHDSDFVSFRTRLSTVADQHAIAPGTLEKQWTAGGRAYFDYRMEAPMMHFYAVVSAEYTVHRDQWGEVPIEIYHHAPHHHNLARMSSAVKDSLALFSQVFSPYQYDHFRIVEFPAYHPYAQSFAGMVPYSESLGFVSQIGPDDIDLPYYVTAHETAHQWWGHQVTAANCQGASFLNETLAQYSALLVMEQKYGRNMIHKFLTLELDGYLSGRADDPDGELPLYRVESQDYIHYRKGSLVMYALRDYLGADRVNRVLQRLLALRAYQSEPYATSRDFLKLLREEAGPEYDAMIRDFFEKITLYDLHADSAQVVPLSDGRYEVTVQVGAGKLYADALGNETRAAFDLPVDIGLFQKHPTDAAFSDEDVILLEKAELSRDSETLTFTVAKEPRFVGIDPYHKLIDRDIEDNVIAVR